jgi:predicted anti-sigma-YlaC factor YlaD
MKCPQIHALLATSLDEPLRPAEQAEVDAHLLQCPDCVRWLTEKVLVVEVLRRVGKIEEAELPPPVPEHLVRRVLAAHRAAMVEHKKGRKSG